MPHTFLGSGLVTIKDREPQQWARIELHDGNVLRLSRIQKWTSTGIPAQVTCQAETLIEYHAAGDWTSITLDVPANGSLILVSNYFPNQVIRARITEQEAIDTAAQFLIDNYEDAEHQAQNAAKFFNHYPYDTGLLVKGGDVDRPTFYFQVP